MKRFYIKLLIFALIVIAIDFGFGVFFDHYRRATTAGMTNLDRIAAEETRAPIIVVGSSRARRHYDTRIITDSLGAECFNCGVNNMGIEFILPRIRQMLKRYTPKLIIYDVTPLYDLMESNSWPASLSGLKTHFNDAPVSEAIRQRDPLEWVKCLSATYRYHRKLKDIESDRESKEVFHNGYAPLRGTKGVKKEKHAPMTPDPAKLAMVEELIAECKNRGVELVFVLSPYYNNDMGDQGAVLRPIARRHNLTVIDHFNDKAYVKADSLFWDQSHMNAAGADVFTRTVVSEIKNLD